MSYCKLHLLLLSSLCAGLSAYEQSVHNYSTDSSLINALQYYHRSLGDQSGIFNGSLYLRPSVSTGKGHVYFNSDTLAKGSVLYEGIFYSSVSLLYDEEKDALVTTDISGLNLVTLVKQKVESFSIGNNRFLNIPYKDNPASGPSYRYFRVIRDGHARVLHRETKFLRQKIVRENETEYFIDTQPSYWLSLNGVLHKIDNMRNLYDAVGSNKKELQNILQKRQLRFRNNPELTLVEAAIFFENLSRP